MKEKLRFVDLSNEKVAPEKFYNFRSTIKLADRRKTYNLRSMTNRDKCGLSNNEWKIRKEKLRKQVEEYARAGEVQVIKQATFIPSNHGNWSKDRLPCPNCNIDICKLPGWSCDNVCCRSCLFSFC